MGTQSILDMLTVQAQLTPQNHALLVAIKWGILGTMWVGTTADMAVYGALNAKSHNAAIYQTATRREWGSVRRADGTIDTLGFQEVQYDLHEAPFAQVASVLRVGAKGDSLFELRIDTGSTGTPKGLEIPIANLQEIHYPDPFWETRWAVRHERHDPAGGGTRVRQVRRWNLPVELLTTSQPRSIDFQIDDLHPDRMEQMELVLNYGLHRFVWDRETGKDTYTLTYFQSGKAWSATSGLPNPIDALGRWRVPLRELIPSEHQVLLDGQNVLGISLVNGVGRHSAQRQFLTFQAAAPSLAMRFPQPWGVVSDPAGLVRFRADLLHYPGIRFDTAQAGWALVPGDSTGASHPIDSLSWKVIPGLVASDSIQDLVLPMIEGWTTPVDGPWELALRIPALQPASGQLGQPGARRFPLWLDRTAPRFRLEAEPRRRGEPWRFRLHWTDLPDGLADVVQLVRLRVVDRSGTVAAELPPLEQASVSGVMVSWDGLSGGRMVPDGQYRLEVEGMDGAIADAATLEQVMALRRSLLQAILEGRDPWTSANLAAWSGLRNDRRLNWGAAQGEFLVDRTAPVVVPDALPTTPIGLDARFRLPLRVSDPGGSGNGIRMRLEFRDEGAGAAFAQVRELPAVSTKASDPTAWSFQEGNDPQATLPDGNWQVRALFEDADGNRDSVVIPGRLRIDRTLPAIAQLRAAPSYLSSQATESVGPAVVDAGDARTVAGRWTSPDGAVVEAEVGRDATGLWTLSYPRSIRRARGTWTLEVVATDSAGNAVRRSTFVQVDLVPPRLKVPTLVDGAVVLTGLAMDPDLDEHPFAAYELSWRPAGSQEWRHDGMRVPGGRGPRTEPWRSLVPQSAEGVLGFWDPPADVSGEVELRVRVDDGTESVHEALASSYATSREAAPFEVSVHLPDTLRAGIGQPVGWSVRGRSEAAPRAMAVLVDSAGSPLMVVQRDGIEASVADGKPASLAEGSLHLWREDSKWVVQASGACRGLDVLVQTRSPSDLGLVCPTGWSCSEDTMPRVRLDIPGAEALEVDHVLRWRIPAFSRERLEWTPPAVSRLTVVADSIGRACAEATGCPEGGSVPPVPMPAPGEVRIGDRAKPVCDGLAVLALRTGKDRSDAAWDGFRTDGNWPSSGKARLEVDLWDPASMRVVNASRLVPMRPGDLALGAKVLGAVVRSGDAPGAQNSAALEYTVEGRAAKVGLSIHSGDRLVRRLPGDGTWKEGRSARRPWTVEWDGTDDRGSLVPSGRYRFVVEADGQTAQAEVEVGGQAWRTDSTLRLSFAPTEARWSPGLQAWQLMPPAEVLVGTGVKARSVGQDFSYQMRYEGTQDVVAFRTHRPSLMVRRKRDRVKFGLIWKVTTIQYGYDSKQSIGGCGDRSGPEFNDVPVTQYFDGGVVDLGRGETIQRELEVPMRTNTGETTWRMGEKGHQVEWVAVPLTGYAKITSDGLIDISEWQASIRDRFATGSFRIDNFVVTPTHGLKDQGTPVVQGTWLSEPPAPRTCRDSTLARTDLDGALDSRDWTRNHCPEVPDNEEVVNPNRNLLQMRVAANHSFSMPLTSVTIPTFVWANGDAGAACANSDLNRFSFAATMRIPERFFDAEPGIDNLANRLLRFDASNRFLYGPGAFLSQDGIDNDGNGRPDDAPETQGTISPFERRAYEWRPLHSDLGAKVYDCSGFQEVQVPEWCTEIAEGNTECRPGDPPGAEWTAVGEPAACDPYGISICQTWRGWVAKTCSRTVLQASDAQGNILEDKLNFFEGDHAITGDRLELWFTNTPEAGSGVFRATVGQGERVWSVDSRSHQGVANAKTILLMRGSFRPLPVQTQKEFLPDPVRITVDVDDDLIDATSSSGAWASLPWPLDERSWKRAKETFEAPCQSLDPVDPSACRRVHLAASGVRLGIDDGLAPTRGGIVHRSRAQEEFFRDRAAGRSPNPDGLPMGRIPSGSGVRSFPGTLALDALGRLVHVDSLHRGLPRPDVEAGATFRTTTPVNQEGFQVEGPDARGDFRWEGLAQPGWSLDADPRVRPRNRLESTRRWRPGQEGDRVALLDLYRATARPFPDGRPGVGLYVGSPSTTHAPNTAALGQVRLDSLAVSWRDGSDASSRFDATALEPDATGYPGGVFVRRRGAVAGMPEWLEVRGAVPAGRTYQLGWSTPMGGWREATAARISDCPASESSLGRCPLGFVDAARLPEMGRLLLRVQHGGEVAFQSLPFVRGLVLPDTGTTAARSLFGDAEVVFPSGALVGKPDSLRAVSVRLLSPAEAGIPSDAGIAVTGPVVEILPSQGFPTGSLPEIVLRLPREALVAQGLEPSQVRLFRVDVQAGRTTLLEDQLVRYFREGQAVDEDGGWTVAEFHARTSSFSSFALLPASTPDSRLWSVSVTPSKGTARERLLETRGVGLESLDFHWDDDPVFLDPADPTAPVGFRPVVGKDGAWIQLPERSRSWLTVRSHDGGLPRTLEVEWIRGDFQFVSRAADTLVAGVGGGGLRIPYVSSHSGSLRLTVPGASGALAWVGDSLQAGEGIWTLALPGSWSHLGPVFSTRLVATDEAGRVREVEGPVVRLDAVRPVCALSGSVHRAANGWSLHLQPWMDDSDGAIVSSRIEVRLADGTVLGAWEGIDPVQTHLDDLHAGARVRATLVVEDAGGNRSSASWEGIVAGRESESALWLVPEGDATRGWSVVDRGHHGLGVRSVGSTRWIDGAVSFEGDSSGLETESVAFVGKEATIEVFGSWTSGQILLGRRGSWRVSRRGTDLLLDGGSRQAVWNAVFTSAAEWRHLVLVQRRDSLHLVVDGRERGGRPVSLSDTAGVPRTWYLGGGRDGSRFALARVWTTAWDQVHIERLRAEATGLDSVLWQEAEWLDGGSAFASPDCHLPSRLAVVVPQGGTRVVLDVQGPRNATLAGRWRSDSPLAVSVSLDGTPWGSAFLPARPAWGPVEAWTTEPGAGTLDLPAGSHRLVFHLPEGLELDGLALVSGTGNPSRWIPETDSVQQVVDVLARDESPNDLVHFRPRIVVRNRGPEPLMGYRLHLQVRPERGRNVVADTWWPTPLSTILHQGPDGLVTWRLERSNLRLATGQSDFEGAGAAVGFHHDDWSSWSRTNDPVWDDSWTSGAWTTGATVGVTSLSGRLLAPLRCSDEQVTSSEVSVPRADTLRLDGSGPKVFEGRDVWVVVEPTGDWAWSSTVLGLSPLDGLVMEGALRVEGELKPLAGWWQSMSLPNAGHTRKVLRLTFPVTRRVQIQTWEQ